MSVKYSKRSLNLSRFSKLRPSKIYPNWDFLFENKPSGNPVIRLRVSARNLPTDLNQIFAEVALKLNGADAR
jgi:hypothetical protein